MNNFKKKVKALVGKKGQEVSKVNEPEGVEQPGTAVASLQQSDDAQVASSSIVDTKKNYIPEKSRYNFKVLHDPPQPVVDIFFIHGLTGDREKTWTRTKGKLECFWPRDLLPEDISNARIAVWGYDASVIKKTPFTVVSTNTLDHHAQTLCNDIASLRGEKNKQPIIFVVHSLGGLVCKTALLHSSEANTTERAHLKEVCDRTRAIAFMGTPHQGSSKASWGVMLASALGEAPHLNELQKRFLNFLEFRKQQGDAIDVTCFFEELPLPVFGTIVPDQSVTIPGYESIGIHDDHSAMTKFGGDDSPGYKRVLGELQRWVANLQVKKAGETQKKSPAETPGGGTVTHHGNVGSGGVALYGEQKFQNSGTTNFGGTHTVHNATNDKKEGES
ncbi:hypothetical protein EG329_006303 [Mollisiaceae sp. DMI_Dod_QoI]|nr:hypothetical protein EG329_006303 [Helotiales sp. DMI_Dod_QoI]